MKELIQQLQAARAVSTPLILITSPDQSAVAAEIKAQLNGDTMIISWDRARGLRAYNEKGANALQYIVDQLKSRKLIDDDEFGVMHLTAMTGEAASAMKMIQYAPPKTIVLAFSLDRFFRTENEGSTIQAILNLRQEFKANQRTLIGLSPDVSLPPELQHDVLVLDDPLPTVEGYTTITQTVFKLAKLASPAKPELEKIVRAVRGLSSFEAEQTLAMSFAMSGGKSISLDNAWKLKQSAVAKIKGLTLTMDGPPLEDLRGLDAIISDLNRLWDGPEPPELIVRVDEFDKSMAGLGQNGGPGDNTGVTQDLNQNFLTNMEGNGWIGYIFAGVRGSGKTALSEALGKAHGIPTISVDTGAMMQKHVGESQQAFREAFRTIKSIGGKRVLVLATCNNLSVLPPELLRRFKLGIVFFDLLSKEERNALWPVYLKKFGHKLDVELPNDEGWSGSDIRNCCEIAYLMKKSISEVGQNNIVPVSKADPKSIERMRSQAHGSFLSASRPGVYLDPVKSTAVVIEDNGRKFA